MPDDLPPDLIEHLGAIRVAGQALRISRDGEPVPASASVSAPAAPAPRKEKPAEERPVRKAAPEPALSNRDDDDEPAFSEASEDDAPKKKKKDKHKVSLPMAAFRLEVGSKDSATPSNIVGAIANEAGLEAKYIGRLEIFDDHTMIELPDGMPDDIFRHLGKVWVGGKQLRISHANAMPPMSPKHTPPKDAPGGKAGFGKGAAKSGFKAAPGSTTKAAPKSGVAKPGKAR
jgi:ATP-dependent RNA helicase DeaD